MALLTDIRDGILTLTLNRPEKRNALDYPTVAELHAALDAADLDAAVRVVALRGAGKDFCAGADLAELLESAERSLAENETAAMHLGSLFVRMRALPKVIVAVTHGRVLAGGAGLATACDLVLAPESGTFGYPEIQRGFVPAMVMTMLRRVVGEKAAFELAATGRVLAAAEAERVGLITRVFPDAEYSARAEDVLGGLAATSGSALAMTKQQFYHLDGMSFDDGVQLGARVNAAARATADFRDAIREFLHK